MKKNTITGTRGDTKIIRRRVPNVDPADPLSNAWFTVKAALADADPGVVQKAITTSYVGGAGHINDDGATLNGNGVAKLFFELTAANTEAIGATGVYYDIQVKSAAGGIYTLEKGTVNFGAEVTKTS